MEKQALDAAETSKTEKATSLNNAQLREMNDGEADDGEARFYKTLDKYRLPIMLKH